MKNEEIEKLYGAMREREEGMADTFLRNYYAGYCDALKTIYIFLEGEEEQTAQPEETAKSAEEGKYLKTCKQCGREFRTNTSQRKYCPECSEARDKKAQKKRKHEQEMLEAGSSIAKENKEKQDRTNRALNEMARIQKETGISYGQQMDMKYKKEERN